MFDSPNAFTTDAPLELPPPAAHFIISDAFKHSPAPFQEAAYKDIGFPLRAGKIQDRDAIINSEAFRRIANQESGARYFREFNILPDGTWENDDDYPIAEVAFLKGACEQFRQLDYARYGQSNVLWNFMLDIKSLAAGYVHRPDVNGDAVGLDDTHIDGQFGNSSYVSDLFEKLRAGNHRFGCSDIQRFWITANVFPTEFPGKSFENWDIIHFAAEPHKSPRAKHACTRAFLWGAAIPMRPGLGS